MNLTIEQRQRLINLLLTSFGRYNALEDLATFYLDTNLALISDHGPLGEVAQRLATWCERNPPKLEWLLIGMVKERPGRTDIRALAGELGLLATAPPVPITPQPVYVPEPIRPVYVAPTPVPIYVPPSLPASISAPERRQLFQLLSSVSMLDMGQIAQLATGANLNRHADTSNASNAAFDLIQFCEAQGHLPDLFRSINTITPDLPGFRALWDHLKARRVLP